MSFVEWVRVVEWAAAHIAAAAERGDDNVCGLLEIVGRREAEEAIAPLGFFASPRSPGHRLLVGGGG